MAVTEVTPLHPAADTFDPDTVRWVQDPGDLDALLDAVRATDEVVVDLETTGLNEYATGRRAAWPVPARISMASFTLPVAGELDHAAWVIALSHPDSPWRSTWRRTLHQITSALHAAGKPMVNQNLKFDLRWLYRFTNIDLSGLFSWDTQISSHLLNEVASTKLKERAPATFGVRRWDDHDLSIPGASEKVPLYELGIYAARDTYWTWKLAVDHRRRMFLPLPGEDGVEDQPRSPEEIEDARLGQLAINCAMPTSATLTAIEQRGLQLDVAWVEEHITELDTIADETFDQLAGMYEIKPEIPGEDLSPSMAPTSLYFRRWAKAAVQARDLRVAAMTDKGNPQWTKRVLRNQARHGSDAAAMLLRYRAASKRLEFLHGWLEVLGIDGRIHATYNAGKVITGRLSCVTADTLIDMPRDMIKYPDGVPITEVRPGDWVYSFDHRRELTLRQVEWVGQTGVKPTVVVTVRNKHGHERVIRCTPEHLVRLRSGDYRHAERLQPGDVVMPMVRRGYDHANHGGYLTFFPHSINRGNGQRSGGKNKEHRWVAEWVYGKRLSTKTDVHHRNGTMLDNTPSNLLPLTIAEHRSIGHQHPRRGEERERPATYLGPNDYRVVSVEPGEVEPVWDMTVPEDHCFVADGIVVHNSNSPNMQQVTAVLKPAFVADPGWLIADIDYSQIELRVAAFIARCEPMLAAYRRGDDLHRLMAARLTGKRPEDVDPAERQRAKAANFGLLYGMGPEGFQVYAEDAYAVELTLEEAYASHRAFFELWTGMDRWQRRAVRIAHRDGQISSPIGRVRRLPDLQSGNPYYASSAERQAINSPVQGMASDLMQMAAASIEGYLPDTRKVKGARLVGTVHDSILVEVPASDPETVARACIDRMVTLHPWLHRMGCDFDVPLAAEAIIGKRWGEKDLVIT